LNEEPYNLAQFPASQIVSLCAGLNYSAPPFCCKLVKPVTQMTLYELWTDLAYCGFSLSFSLSQCIFQLIILKVM